MGFQKGNQLYKLREKVGRIKKECLACKKEFETWLYEKNRKCCSQKCAGIIKADIMSKRMKEYHMKNVNKIGFKKNHPQYSTKGRFEKGNKLSDEIRLKIVEGVKRFWDRNGRIGSLGIQIRNSMFMKEWKKSVYKRDNYTCQFCKRRNVFLHAHHIKPFSYILYDNKISCFENSVLCSELWDIDNGITLCKSCHFGFHLKFLRCSL